MPQKDRAVIKQQYNHDPQYVRCRHELSEGQSQCYAISCKQIIISHQGCCHQYTTQVVPQLISQSIKRRTEG